MRRHGYLAHSDYSEKWPVTNRAPGSLYRRKEGSR
jgi:hypothetical protein